MGKLIDFINTLDDRDWNIFINALSNPNVAEAFRIYNVIRIQYNVFYIEYQFYCPEPPEKSRIIVHSEHANQVPGWKPTCSEKMEASRGIELWLS